MACNTNLRRYDYAGSERVRVRGMEGANTTWAPGNAAFTAGDVFSPVLQFGELGSCSCGNEHGSGIIESVILTETIDPADASGFQNPQLTLWLMNAAPSSVPAVNSPLTGIVIPDGELVAILNLGSLQWNQISTSMSVGQLNLGTPYIIPSGILYGLLTVQDTPDWTEETTAMSIELFVTKD